MTACAEGDGGIERWLKLTDSLGFSRDYVTSTQGILPGTRFAVEAYTEFCRDAEPLRGGRLVPHGIVFARHHQRAGRGHACPL